MIFGTFVGSLSDKLYFLKFSLTNFSGRKLSCCIYALGYILSCVTKHFNIFSVLLVGRVLGGISTSILFSAFDSWMINEHFENGFDKEWISFTFFVAVFFNSVVAIIAGIIANTVTGIFDSMVAPFDAAIVFLTVGLLLIVFLWKENYGDRQANVSKSFIEGIQVLRKDRGILLLGICQSFFEAAMYIFVFMWTPVLDECFGNYSHGMIFAIYMVVVMAGSSVFNLVSEKIRKEVSITVVFFVAAIALACPIFFIGKSSRFIVFGAFNVFEFCVGMFWPAMGSLKSVYIPENVRSTVMNYFRLPTNFFVLVTLYFIDSLPFSVVFAICSLLVLMAAISSTIIVFKYDKDRKYVKVATIDETFDADSREPVSMELNDLKIEEDLQKKLGEEKV